MDAIRLNSGLLLPGLGYGVYQIVDEDECRQGVRTALHNGYRLIDTAACYGNEKAVGSAIQESLIPRGDIVISSKVWIQNEGYQGTMRSFETSLENLQTSYLDLYLIHMPYGDYQGSWRALEDLYDQGRVRAIGVCNFLPDRLVDLILSSRIAPMVDQVELHPFTQQTTLLSIMAKYGIAPMAWAPLAEGKHGIFRDRTLIQIGERYGKTPAQVILRWLTQKGICAIPKSVHEARIRENHNIADFILDQKDIQAIETLDMGRPLILDLNAPQEVQRLHAITYKQ